MSATQKKNLDVEAFRAYAILITVVAHVGVIFPEWREWSKYFWLGGGVDLFFCISGFLITGSLLDSLEKKRAFWVYAKVFWVRRVFRLWPAALFWSTLLLCGSVFFGGAQGYSIQDLWKTWLFGALNCENLYIYMCVKATPPCGWTPLWHYWSLSLEEQFYLLLPFVLFFVARRKLLIWLFLLIAVLQAGAVRPWGGLLWFMRSDALFYGSVVAIGWQYYSGALHWVFARLPRRLAQVLLATLSVLLIVVAREAVSPHYHGLVAATAGAMVFLVSRNADFITTGRAPRLLAVYIGSRSYSIYLVHLPVFAVFHEILMNFNMLGLGGQRHQLLTFALGLAFSLALAEFSFRLIESPLRRFGRRLSYRSLAEVT